MDEMMIRLVTSGCVATAHGADGPVASSMRHCFDVETLFRSIFLGCRYCAKPKLAANRRIHGFLRPIVATPRPSSGSSIC